MRHSKSYTVLGERRISRFVGATEACIAGVKLDKANFVGPWRDPYHRLALPFQLGIKLHSRRPSLDRFLVNSVNASRLTHSTDEDGTSLTQLDIGGVDGAHVAHIHTKFNSTAIKGEVLGLTADKDTDTLAEATQEPHQLSFWRNPEKLVDQVMGWDSRGVRLVCETDSLLGESLMTLHESLQKEGEVACLPLHAYPQADRMGIPILPDRSFHMEGYLLVLASRISKEWRDAYKATLLLEAHAMNRLEDSEIRDLKRRLLAFDEEATLGSSPRAWNHGLPSSRHPDVFEVQSSLFGNFVCTFEQLDSVLTHKEISAYEREFLKSKEQVWGYSDLGPELSIVESLRLFSPSFSVLRDQSETQEAPVPVHIISNQNDEYEDIRAAG